MNKVIICFLGMILASCLCVADATAASRGGSVGTATVGGTYYIWAGPWTKIIQDNIPGYTMNVEVTGGPVHNIKLIETGDLDWATVSMPAVYEGWVGSGWAKGKEYRQVRTVFPMYPSYATFYAKASAGINNVRDLEGKIFAPGPKGGTPDTYYREFLKLLNIKPGKIVNAAMSDIPSQIMDGMIDVGAGSGGEPFAPAVELDSLTPVKILDFNKEDMEAIIKEHSTWYIGNRKPGGYKLQTETKPTLQYWNLFICRKDLDDALVYKVVDAFFNNLKSFENVYRETMETVPQDVAKSLIPLHPGAARWYKEHGVNLPTALLQ